MGASRPLFGQFGIACWRRFHAAPLAAQPTMNTSGRALVVAVVAVVVAVVVVVVVIVVVLAALVGPLVRHLQPLAAAQTDCKWGETAKGGQLLVIVKKKFRRRDRLLLGRCCQIYE